MSICFSYQSTWFFDGIVKKILLKEILQTWHFIIIVHDCACCGSTLNQAWCQQLFSNCRTDGETETAAGRTGERGQGRDWDLSHVPASVHALSSSLPAASAKHPVCRIPSSPTYHSCGTGVQSTASASVTDFKQLPFRVMFTHLKFRK